MNNSNYCALYNKVFLKQKSIFYIKIYVYLFEVPQFIHLRFQWRTELF